MNTVSVMVPRDAFIAVCMMSNRKHGTLTLGVTSNLKQRAWQHREGMIAAIQREKSLKKYERDWKINLIERDNPHWNDCTWYSSPEAVFMGGRDNGPAMTNLL